MTKVLVKICQILSATFLKSVNLDLENEIVTDKLEY